MFSNRTTKLKACVPVLAGSYEALKSQFDWLMKDGCSGDVAHRVTENLPRELDNMELFLRCGKEGKPVKTSVKE